MTFPAYVVILVLLIAGRDDRLRRQGRAALDRPRLHPPAAVGVHEAGDRAGAGALLRLLPAGDIRRWRAIWPAALLVGVPPALILVQPDLGTAMMVLLGGVTVMFVAGLPMWYVPRRRRRAPRSPCRSLFAMMHDYQRKRVLIFLDPESDPLGAGYHISQSKIAIGSGGILGKGYLNGSQSHLDYLPEGHTDFVFATMVEEWGLVGGALLIFAFAMVIRWGMTVSRKRQDPLRPARRGRPAADHLLLRRRSI